MPNVSVGPIYNWIMEAAVASKPSDGPKYDMQLEVVPKSPAGRVYDAPIESVPRFSSGRVYDLIVSPANKWRLKQLNLIEKQEVTAATTAVQGASTIYNLSASPAYNASVLLFLNGLVLRQGLDYTISGNTITYLGGQALNNSTDSFTVTYVTQL
jgi:hypothetical protein